MQGANTSFDRLLSNINTQIVTPIIYLLVVLAVIYFIYGVLTFVRNADNPEERAKGYQHMIWGVIGVFIMVSAKGIINVILATLGI